MVACPCFAPRASVLLSTIATVLLMAALTGSGWAQNENETVGFSPTHAMDNGYFGEDVDILNGNLNLSVPIGPRYQVTSHFSYQLVLNYNSKIWADSQERNYRLIGESPAGVGFSLHLGKLIIAKHLNFDGTSPNPTEYDLYVVTPDGGRHLVVDSSGYNDHGARGLDEDHFTNDTSYMKVRAVGGTAAMAVPAVQSWRVLMADGTTYTYARRVAHDGGAVGFTDEAHPFDGWYVSRIESREQCVSGGVTSPCNYIDIAYDDVHSHSISTIQEYRDGAMVPERRIDIITEHAGTADVPAGCVASISLPAFGGTRAAYSFTYSVDTLESPFTLNQFETTPPRFPNQALLREVVLPTDYRLRFGYDLGSGHDFGEITQRELPTGALSDYLYATYPYASVYWQGSGRGGTLPSISGRHQTRSIYRRTLTLPNGPTGALSPFIWHYSRDVEITQSGVTRAYASPFKVVVTDPFSNDTVYSYFASLPWSPEFPCSASTCAPQWEDGMPYRIEYYRGKEPLPAQTLPGVLLKSEDRYYEADINPLSPDSPTKNNARSWKSVVSTYEGGFVQKTEARSGWDNFGHHKVIVESGDGVATRITVTDWQPVDTSTIRIADVYAYRAVQSEGRVVSREDVWSSLSGSTIGRVTDVVQRKNPAQSPWDDRPSPPPTSVGDGDIWTHYGYDPLTGNATAKTILGGDAGGHGYRIGYTYQAGGYLKTKEFLDPATGLPAFSSPWLAIDRDRDLNTGLIFRSRSPHFSSQAPLTTTYEYDPLGRLTGITPPSPEHPTLVVYPTANHTIVRQAASSSDGIQSEYFYDDLGRLITVQKLEADGAHFAVQHTQRDVDGALRCQSEWIRVPGPFQTNAGPFVGDLCAAEGVTVPRSLSDYTDEELWVPPPSGAGGPQKARDPFARVSKFVTADGKVARTRFVGEDSFVTLEEVQSRDSSWQPTLLNATTTYRKDAFGRLRAVEAPPGGPLDQYASAEYRYDARDNLAEARLTGLLNGAPTTQVRSFEYDALNRLIRADNPENGTSLSEKFDPMGNILQLRDAKGNVFLYSYDAAGRLLETRTGGGGVLLASNRYDQNADGSASGYSAGQLVGTDSFDDAGALIQTKAWQYNGLNARLGSEKTRFSGVENQFVTQYSYNGFGLLESMTYPPDGTPRPVRRPTFSYANGYLQSVLDATEGATVPVVEAVHYNPAGGIADVLTHGAVREVVTPDVRNRPGRIEVTKLDSVGLPILSYWDTGPYRYDGAGNIAEIGEQGGTHLDFAYDAVGRLVGARIDRGSRPAGTPPSGDPTIYYQAGYDLRFEYDPFGNLNRKSDAAPTPALTAEIEVDPLTNQVTRVDGADFTHDGNGNLASDKDNVYQWDSRNRLLRVRSGPASGNQDIDEFGYDASGYRVVKKSQGSQLTTYYVRDNQGQVLSEFSRPTSSASLPLWRMDYLYAAGRVVALAERDKPDPPTNLLATQADCQSGMLVHLTWERSRESDVTVYQVFRNDQQISVADVPADRPEYDDSIGLAAGQSYIYQVKARDLLSGSDLSSQYVMQMCDTTPPSPPALSVPTPGESSVLLTWGASTDNPGGGVAGYFVFRRVDPADDPGGAGFTQLNSFPVRGSNFLDLDVQAGVTYWYFVRARDTAGNLSIASAHHEAVPIDTTSPTPPRNLRAHSGCGATDVYLTWDLSPEKDVLGYRLYRGTSPAALSQVGTYPVNPPFPVAQPHPNGDVYYYGLQAYDTAFPENRSSMSTLIQARLRMSGTSLAPTSLETEVGSGNVTLTWQEGADRNRFTVYRRELGQECTDFLSVFSGTLAPAPGGSTFSYVDRSVSNGTAYEYVVSATDSSDVESPDSSPPVVAVPLETPNVFQTCVIPGGTINTQIAYAWREVAPHRPYDPAEAARKGKGYVGFMGYYKAHVDEADLPFSAKDVQWDNKIAGFVTIGTQDSYQVRAVYKVNDWKYCDGLLPTDGTVCTGELEELPGTCDDDRETSDPPTCQCVAYDNCLYLARNRIAPVENEFLNPASNPSIVMSAPTPPLLIGTGITGIPLCEGLWPARPENLQASATSNEGEIRLDWSFPSNMGRVAGYQIFVGDADELDPHPIELAPNVNSYNISNVPACKNLWVAVESFDSMHVNSADASMVDEEVVAPLPLGSVPPPDNPVLRPGPQVQQLEVLWQEPSVVSCDMPWVEVKRTSGGVTVQERVPSGVVGNQIASHVDSNLVVGATYAYELRGVFTQNVTEGTTPVELVSEWRAAEPPGAQPQDGGIAALQAPAAVSAAAGPSSGSAVITWGPVANAEGYRLRYWWQAQPRRVRLWNPVALITDTSVTVNGLRPGRTYRFVVTSANRSATDPVTRRPSFLESAWSSPATLMLPHPGHVPPPTNVSAVPGGAEGEVILSWTAAPSPAIGYYIYDVTEGMGPIRRVNVSGGEYAQFVVGTSATVAGLPLRVRRTFAVRSVDDSGRESDYSNPATVYPFDKAPMDPRFYCGYCEQSHAVIHLQWTGTGDPETAGYVLTRAVNPACPATNPNFRDREFPHLPVSQESFTDTAVAFGCTYTYALWTVDQEGNFSIHYVTARIPNDPTCVDFCDPTLMDGSGNIVGRHCTGSCWPDPAPITHPRLSRYPELETSSDQVRLAQAEPGCPPGSGTPPSGPCLATMAPYRPIGIKPVDEGGGGGGGGYVPPSFHWRYFHPDHLGTPRIVTDSNGAVVSEHHYLPFGEEVPPSSHNGVVNQSNNSHRFTGHERDAETGLDYMMARYYGSCLGRFMAVDPAAESINPANPQTWNRYTYVLNNPLMLIDPTGETLTVSGSDSAKMKFQDTANSGLYGKDTKIDSKGNVTLVDNGVQGPPSPEQASFEQTLNQAISDPANTSLSLVEGASLTPIDSFPAQEVDMNDVQAYGNGPGASAVGWLAHDVAEQYAKQVGGVKDYKTAHFGPATDAENGATGYKRGAERGYITYDPATGDMSGRITVPYTRGSTVVNVTTTVRGGNVTKVDPPRK